MLGLPPLHGGSRARGLRALGAAFALLVLLLCASSAAPAVGESFEWRPYGPSVERLVFKHYSGVFSELSAFEAGELDLTDTPVPPSKFAAYEAAPDLVLTPPRPELSIFQIDFNHESSVWARWGCDFQNANSRCGIHIRAAFAHLVDRAGFVGNTLGATGVPVADPTSPAQIPGGSSAEVQRSWDTLHPEALGAFDVAPDGGGFPAEGSPDFCAAKEHLVAAGIGLQDVDGDCVIDHPLPAAVGANPIRFMIRSDDPARLALGNGLSAAIEALFGADVVSPRLGSFGSLFGIVFGSVPLDDWDMYTGGFELAAFANHLAALWGSEAASNLCGGNVESFPLNYGFVCIPEFDASARGALEAPTVDSLVRATTGALDEYGKHVATIPVYSSARRGAYLRDAQGVVQARGTGIPNSFSLLGARDDPEYGPSDPTRYAFGGGDRRTLRFGQRSGTETLNPFRARTVIELRILEAIYDTLVVPNPTNASQIIGWMANRFELVQPSEPGYRPPKSTVLSVRLGLRNTLEFHDGQPVTAEDVKFSIENLQAEQGILRNVVGATALDEDEVDVHFSKRGFLRLFELSDALVVPRHVWDGNRDGRVDRDKLEPSFDPVQTGALIGSGPFVCSDASTGQIGGGCAAGQRVGPGGTVVLHANAEYHRSLAEFEAWNWADRDDDFFVSNGDLADIRRCFGKAAPDAECPSEAFAYWDRLAPEGVIDHRELAEVARRIGETWTFPFSWSALDNVVAFAPFMPVD